ncbi:hypothetical protein GCM10010522_10910 [Kribbella solani]
MAAWLARHDATYHLGSTARKVRAEVLRLVRAYDRNPKTYSDFPSPIDGSTIADLAGRAGTDWPRAGQALNELRTATGSTVPPTVKDLFGARRPAPGTPEATNFTMNWAVSCNEDGSRSSFEASWRDYQQLQKTSPVTGRRWGPPARCAGWSLPVQHPTLRHSDGSLILAAHLYENMSVYAWALETRKAVGGTVYTIPDDAHVATTKVPRCAAEVVTYFVSGARPRPCPGLQPPA